MVVNDDQGGGVLADSRPEKLAHPHLGRIQRSLVNSSNPQDVIASVKGNDPELLLLQGTHLVLHQISSIFRAVDNRPILGSLGSQTPPQIYGGFELGRFGFPDPMLGAYFRIAGPLEAGQPIKLLQQPLTDLDRAFASHTCSQQDGQQFGSAQHFGSHPGQSLSRPLLQLQIFDAW
jgi:hypothetical protein